jgi:hypothetical protein
VIIRDQQIKTLEDSLTRNFEDEMSRHVHEFTPMHCKVIGDAGVHDVIHRSIDAASKYGFTQRGPVRLYIDLTFMFGSDFDTDPLLQWAGEILKSGGASDQMDRAERLHARALAFSDASAGPDYAYAKEAFRRARSVRYEDLTLPPGDFESGCLTRLREGHSHKFDHVGEPAVRAMIPEAVGKARQYSISAQPGVLLFVTLMFAIGHGFAEDPLFPWISHTLNNEAISDPNKRAERVYSKTMTYLDQVIANLG